MLTYKQLSIFAPFAADPFSEMTLKELKEACAEKSNNAMSIAMNRFRSEALLNEKKVGNSTLFSLNFDADQIFDYISIINKDHLDKVESRIINEVIAAAARSTPFACIVVFGSHATKYHKKDSDLDIAVFVEGDSQKRKMEIAMRTPEQLSILSLDWHVFTRAEMIQMLTDEDDNLGKQIARKHIAVHNPKIFYGLIQEGMKKGFRSAE